MAIDSLTHHAGVINLADTFHSELSTQLTKAAALAEIAITEGFLQAKPSVMHDYLWALHDIIVRARTLCDEGR